MYTVTNCHGLPQCGSETLTFDEWEEFEAYAEEFAEWCKSIGGRRIMTESDAYPLVDEWMSTQPRPLGCEEVEDFEVVHFLFEYGYETEADQTEGKAA